MQDELTADWRAAIVELLPDEYVIGEGLVARLAAATDLTAQARATFVTWMQLERNLLFVGSDAPHLLAGAEHSMEVIREVYRWLTIVPEADARDLSSFYWYCGADAAQSLAALPPSQRLKWARKMLAASKERDRRFNACTEFPYKGSWRTNPHLVENRPAATAYMAFLKAEEEEQAVKRRIFKAAASSAQGVQAPQPSRAIDAVAIDSTRAREHGRSPARRASRARSGSGTRGSPGRARSADDPPPEPPQLGELLSSAAGA